MTIYLYAKQHRVTGLRYFGKTTRDPYTYNGSGKRWTSHCNKHGWDIETTWVHPYEDIDLCEKEFALFLEQQGQALKSEFYIPYVAGRFSELNLGKVKVIPTNAKWFGVTYKEDAPGVKANVQALVDSKVYPNSLW